MDRGARPTTVHGVPKSQTQLNTAQHPSGLASKQPTCQCRRRKRRGFKPWVRKVPWRRKWQYSCLGNSMDREACMGCSSWSCNELGMTKHTCTIKTKPIQLFKFFKGFSTYHLWKRLIFKTEERPEFRGSIIQNKAKEIVVSFNSSPTIWAGEIMTPYIFIF